MKIILTVTFSQFERRGRHEGVPRRSSRSQQFYSTYYPKRQRLG